MSRLAPNVRSIAILREPAARALSHYRERVANGVEPLSFPEAIAREDERIEGELERMLSDPSYPGHARDWFAYRSRGDYLPQLRAWLTHFPREQLLVLRSEDLYAEPQRVYDEVCDFLGLRPHRLGDPSARNASTPGRGDEDVALVLEKLRADLEPSVRELETFLGRRLWS